MPHLKTEIPVVYFHSVAPNKDLSWVRNFLTLELSYFELFLKYLKKNGWQTIFLEEYYQIKKKGKKLSSKICCLTFDDGFLDNYIYAYPLLKKYGFCGTIFVNPEFVDTRRPVAGNLEDVWNGISSLEEIHQWGYLSWDEMKLMQNSNVIDIQSHTLTHTKYYTSDKLVSFHYPGGDCLYQIGNLFPELKPYYHLEKDFESKIPYGTPFFKHTSAVTARRVFINNEFEKRITNMLQDFNWKQESFLQKAMKLVEVEYSEWQKNNRIIENTETENDYLNRLEKEIIESKNIIESKLGKPIEFLCWPHGDNNTTAHEVALDSGFKLTTLGKAPPSDYNQSRISERMGVSLNTMKNSFKTKVKLNAFAGRFPYDKLLNFLRK